MKRYIESNEISLNEVLIEVIAQGSFANIFELEGAIKKLVLYAQVNHISPTEITEYQNQEITITIDYCGIMLSQKDVINHMIIIRGEG